MGRLGARRLFLLAACLGLCGARGALGASFYGESYVELNIIEVSSELSLQLKFQTSKPRGLLFLAAGKNDYCIIELLSGNLRVRVNLGAGKQVLLSEERLRTDDLVWHLVELYYVKNNVSLVIDKHYETTGHITGEVHNLHFQHGIYIAGHGGLDVPYLNGELPNFRGCMEDVLFNQEEILASLRSYPGFKKVYEVSLGCSDEFFAGEDEAINFFSSRSYVTFPEWKVPGEGLLEFALQTGTQQALLLFQSGREGNFVALEIVNGLLRAHVGWSKSNTQLSSLSLVSDNKWHVIQLKFTGSYLALMVDEQGVRTLLPLQSKPFVSEGPLFVGGLNARKGEEVKKLGFASVPKKSARGVSFKGCLRGLEANAEKRALKDALVSKDIAAGCKTRSSDNENPFITTMENLLQSEVPLSTTVVEAGKPFFQDASSYFLSLSNLEIQEGGRALLEQRHMKVDVESEDLGIHHSQILFKIEEMPLHGFLQLDVSPVQEMEKAFTMSDLRQGKVWYVHDGSEEPRDFFTFSVSSNSKQKMPFYLQGRVPYVFNITVIPVNDPPHLKLPEGNLLLLFENSKKRLTPNIIHVSDPDTDSLSLSFSILGNFNSDAGFLENTNDPGKAINGFTHGDLRDGNIFYVHRGPRNSRMLLRASDGELVSNTVVLRVMAVPWGFEVAIRTGVVVQQGGTVLITQSNLSVEVNGEPHEMETRYAITQPPQFGQIQRQGSSGEWKQAVHEDNIPAEAMFIVRIPPMHGYLRKSLPEEGSLGADEKSPLIFTQQDIDDGNIQYVQIAPEQQQDHFLLDVVSGVQAVNGIEILVDIVPKRIPLEVQNFTVQEGGSKALLEDYLKIPSKYFEGVDCEFVLLKPPQHGYVENSNFPRIKLMKFTRKQVENEAIYYVHDDSEELLDNFTIFANSSELGKQSLPQTLFVTVESVNDEAPIITANNILQVWANSVTEITSGDLCAEDEDSSPQDLIYWVSPPSNGHLAFKSFPGQSIQNFTQAQINKGLLVFVHTGAMSGGFNFQVTDGLNFAPRQIFSITARALTISLEVNRGLSIFPGTQVSLAQLASPLATEGCWSLLLCEGSTKPLSSGDLRAVTNDADSTGNRTVTFTVISSPRLGRLVRVNSDNSTEDVSVFTQTLVSEQLILYQHVDRENTGWTAEDSFTFMTSSPPAALGPEEFRITISYEITEPGRHSRLLANTGAAVKEGDKVLIGQSNLDASNLLLKLPRSQRSSYEIWFQVISLPHHGTLMVGERNITKGKPNFSQYIVNTFGIIYLHDDSESLADNFTFAVWPNQKSKSATKPKADFLEEMFNITISPVNDQAPALKTKGLRLKVLQGNRLVVGPENLRVEDLDSPPEEIRYMIIRNPNNGFLALAHHPDIPVHHFTQADIDNSRVLFIQDGSPSSGVFYFSVTDGQHRPLYKLFHLDVIPISITLVNLTDLLLPQGQTIVPITNTHLSAMTNGRSPQITYKMTWPLQHGHLLIENQVVISFGQEDLHSGRLSYHMTNLTASGDQLHFSLFTPESNLTGQTLTIRVQPLLRVMSNLTIANRVVYQLRRKDLDATELANRTKSDPQFEVTEPPVHGRLVRRVGRGAEMENATLFTQRDIDQGLLMLNPHANLTGIDMVNDSFTFLLRADHVQPAIGYLPFTIVPPDPLLLQTFIPDVSLLVTSNNLVTSDFSQEKLVVSSGPTVQTETLGKLTQARQQQADPWGRHHGQEPTMDSRASLTRIIWPPNTTDASPQAPTQPRESNYPVIVIVPSAVVVFLLTVTAVTLCIRMLGRRAEKAKPLIKPLTNLETTTPSPRPKRSIAVPTVTVTPLLKSSSSPPVSLCRDPLSGQMASPATEPVEKCAPWETWMNLDPDMVKLCRQTNPTLKHNQYWV
ncbi:chondroitin sulfate proteoglycan 4-like isoform X5 [Leopardus geoffroyi]|uniref:chondroitin sulfate proteoglycan 4-like isoform X5 n=1 Tax=Leopardus geoffroyi TaxID=46844 RepID=UPI001E263139|nr:chondroitin sulfate proteoglycan 4-like isoform X5 [Leopardus geoffroyi]